ncbi:MAG TPA: hypothetical protein VFU81_02700, partial [Thermomicrobiales bacterium]|nr:hypothetical protein [Thermomicrobiales bacterium]
DRIVVDRRVAMQFLAGTAALAVGAARVGRVSAQATPSPLGGLGLPELTIALTNQGYQAPASATAGWNVVTFHNQLPQQDDGPDLMLIPQGETIQSVFAVVATPAASPALPAWLFQTTFAGGPYAPAGGARQAVVHLTPGDWMVWSAGEAIPPAPLSVAGAGSPAAEPNLTADVEVTLTEYAFKGLEAGLQPGSQQWKVTNAGAQPHFMILGKAPNGATTEQLLAGINAEMTGTPAASALDLTQIPTVGGCTTLSAGQSLYLPLDLAAGSYAAVCFFPDEQQSVPHALLGMATIFTVGEAGAVATP